jgi:hypothetical protein
MTLAQFHASLQQTTPAAGMPPLVEALWWLAKGDWERAHSLAQEVDTRDGAWVHAHLHRAEGDAANAAYWYRQAGKPVCHDSLEDERNAICVQLLVAGAAQR